MDASEKIDAKIVELTDWRGEILARLRELIRQTDPELVEEWKWSTGCWSRGGLVCSFGAFKTHVKLNVFQGAHLPEVQALFNSGLDAKDSRSIDYPNGSTVDAEAVGQIVRAAVAYNAR